MKMRMLTQIPGMTLAVILTLVVAQGLVFGPEARAEGPRGLEGTWLNEVKVWPNPDPSRPCPEPPQNPVIFYSMTTYMRGGILIEGGAPPSPPPAISRSAGHGIWEHTGRHSFRVFFRSHSFDNLGRLVRITEVTTKPYLIKGNDPELEPYYLSGTGTNRATNLTYNPNGTVTETVTHGCNEATSRPILFED